MKLQVPCEGIFWVIDNKLVALKDEVNPRDPYQRTGLLHSESWKSLKNKYLVNGKEVSYKYFPRGRVETSVILNSSNNLDFYLVSVYMDSCTSKNIYKDDIEKEFRLYLPKVKIEYKGNDSHYICHNCKPE